MWNARSHMKCDLLIKCGMTLWYLATQNSYDTNVRNQILEHLVTSYWPVLHSIKIGITIRVIKLYLLTHLYIVSLNIVLYHLYVICSVWHAERCLICDLSHDARLDSLQDILSTDTLRNCSVITFDLDGVGSIYHFLSHNSFRARLMFCIHINRRV